MTRDQALELLKTYNQEVYHLQHAITVEGVMRWFANELGFENDQNHWALIGLLHDIDYEQYPNQHCQIAPKI